MQWIVQLRFGSTLGILLVVAIWASLFAASPLVRSVQETQDIGEEARLFYARLGPVADEFPKDATIRFYDLPVGIGEHKTIYRAGDIKVWLNLRYPGNDMQVVEETTVPLQDVLEDVVLELTRLESSEVAIRVISLY